MFLLGLSLAVLLVVASIALGGPDKLRVFWDFPSMSWVLLGILFHIFTWGRLYFLPGLKVIFRRPKTGDPAIADYFRRLTVWTIGVGVVGMVFGIVWGMIWVKQPEIVGQPVAVTVLTFFYAACLAMMVFAPISVRFSIDETEAGIKHHRFPLMLTLFGLAAYFLTRATMVMVLVSMMSFDEARELGVPNEALSVDAEDVGFVFRKAVFSLNPADFYGSISHYLYPQMYWDFPSLLLVGGCLLAFRLSAGRPKNRFDWIPVSIIYGIIGSITGMVLMLSDLDPDKYSIGCLVALLTAFYGMIAAVFFAIGSWRLVKIFFLSIFVIGCTWFLPFVFLMPFDKRAPFLVNETSCLGFFLTYGILLYFFFRNVIGGVRNLERRFRKPTENTEPMSSDEEEAQKILDKAVAQSRIRQEAAPPQNDSSS